MPSHQNLKKYIAPLPPTARSDPWKPKITFLTKTHLDMLGNVKNMIFCHCNDILRPILDIRVRYFEGIFVENSLIYTVRLFIDTYCWVSGSFRKAHIRTAWPQDIKIWPKVLYNIVHCCRPLVFTYIFGIKCTLFRSTQSMEWRICVSCRGQTFLDQICAKYL